LLHYRILDFENKAAALQAEIAKLEEEKSVAIKKDQLSVVKISELALKLDEIAQVLNTLNPQTYYNFHTIFRISPKRLMNWKS
jgi:hypothetical protein